MQRYLEAWFPILSRFNERIIYIDGFCGPGRYSKGEPGSPLIALDVATNHRAELDGDLSFWFIDERQDRIEHLEGEVAQLQIPQHFEVNVECGQFHHELSGALDLIDAQNAQSAPTFAFIDPFGFSGIPFDVIRRLLALNRSEVLITLMVGSVNRFLILANCAHGSLTTRRLLRGV